MDIWADLTHQQEPTKHVLPNLIKSPFPDIPVGRLFDI